MRHLLLFLVFLLLVGAVYGGSGTLVLVSDNAADAAVADTVKEVKGTNVTVIKTSWGELNESVVSQIKSAAPTGGIVIIGGPAAVVSEYEDLLADYNITRLSGADRKETSAAVLRHFKNDFRGRRLALAYGWDSDGIQEALRRAKANKGIVLFADQDDVPTEVLEALNETNTTEVDVVLSPDTNETRIRSRINRTRSRVADIVRGNDTERANHMIARAAQTIEQLDRALAEINVTKQALVRLSREAHAKLNESKKAYGEGKYGRAFGQAVAANSIAENAMRMARKLHSFEDRRGIAEVKGKIVARYQNILQTVLRLEKVIALEKVTLPANSSALLSEAREHLRLARVAMEANDFGEAVLHLDKAEHAVAGLKVSLIRKNLDQRRIARAPVNVTAEDLTKEEDKDVGRRR